MKIEDLNLSVRAWNCLKRAGIDTVEQLQEMPTKQLERIRGMGSKSIEEIMEKLREKRKAESNIILTLNEEQARIVSIACEFYARVRMGQFGEIVFHCANKHCPEDPEAAKEAWLEFRKQIYPELHGAGHSYGIGKFRDADLAFDVHQVIRHTMGGKVPFSYHPLPKCQKGE